MASRHPGSARERLIVWLWQRLPLAGPAKAVVAWLVNLRFAVGVAAVVLDAQGRVLVLRHTYRRSGAEWGLPGGWARGRESLERALVRELREETGFKLAVDRLVTVHSGFAVPRMTVVYRARIIGGSFRPSAEVSAYEFRPPGTLGDLLGGERLAIEQALRQPEL
jgi:8-oxo-dGTP diphosphatase